MKGVVIKNLFVNNQSPIPFGLKDKAKVKVSPQKCNVDTEVMTIAFRTFVLVN